MLKVGSGKKEEFDFYDSDYDDDDDFIFEFRDSIPDTRVTSLNNNNKDSINKSSKPKDDLLYEVKTNYYYDEKQFVLNDLQNAIIRKNLPVVKNLFEEHEIDVNCNLKTNWTPIMYAVSCGSYDITKYLIQRGADIFYEDDSFSVILCASGCIDANVSPFELINLIEMLIEHGVDVNSYDRYYQTPLMYACKSNNILLIDSLAKAGANLNSQDDNEWTALAHASSKGHLKCVHKLLQLGADPTIYTYDYKYPSDIAYSSGYHDVKKLIKRYIRVKQNDNIKNNNDLLRMNGIDFEDDEDLLDDDDGLVKRNINTKANSLEAFLNALKLGDRLYNFISNDISMDKLLNFDEEDLIKIGISDCYERELILYELKRFHQKNWKSSSMVPIRQDFKINCNEVIAIVSNLSRHTDFMTSNIKYITSESKRSQSQLFADKFLNSKLLDELKETLKNSKRLLNQVESYCGFVEKSVKNEAKTEPIDSVEYGKNKHSWLSNSFKYAAMSGIGISCVAFTISYLKKNLV